MFNKDIPEVIFQLVDHTWDGLETCKGGIIHSADILSILICRHYPLHNGIDQYMLCTKSSFQINYKNEERELYACSFYIVLNFCKAL